MVTLPHTHALGAQNVINKIQAELASLKIPHADSELGYVTVSIGCVTIAIPDEDWKSALKFADDNLYEAKRKGRNTFVMTAID